MVDTNHLLTHKSKSLSLILFYLVAFAVVMAVFVSAAESAIDCKKLGALASDSEALAHVKQILRVVDAASKTDLVIDEECLHQSIKRNFFETTAYLIKEHFMANPKRTAKAESTIRNAIEYVKN